MVNARTIIQLANKRVGRILDVAEAAIPPERFAAFRRVVLREFGADGFESDVERALDVHASTERIGSGRN